MFNENEVPMNLDDDEMERQREILGWSSPDFPPEGMTGAEIEYWFEQEFMEDYDSTAGDDDTYHHTGWLREDYNPNTERLGWSEETTEEDDYTMGSLDDGGWQ